MPLSLPKGTAAAFAVASAVLASCFSPASATARPASTGSSAQVRRAIQAVYDRSDACFSAKNAQGVMARYRDGYTFTRTDGRVNDLSRIRRSMEHIFADTDYVKASTVIHSLVIQGDEAEVKAETDVVASLPRAHSARVTNVEQRKQIVATWAKARGVWNETRCRALSEGSTINGRPVRLR